MPNRVEHKRIEIDLKFAIMIVSYFMCLQGVNLKFLCKGKECFGMRQTNFTSTKHHIANTWLCWSCRFPNKNVTSWKMVRPGQIPNGVWNSGRGHQNDNVCHYSFCQVCSKHLRYETQLPCSLQSSHLNDSGLQSE